MRIIADRDACVGSGQCVLTEPAVFDQDDEGVVLVLEEHPPADAAGQVRTAVQICPAQALSLDEG